MIANVDYYDNSGKWGGSQQIEFDEMEVNQFEIIFYYKGEIVYIVDNVNNNSYYTIKEEL